MALSGIFRRPSTSPQSSSLPSLSRGSLFWTYRGPHVDIIMLHVDINKSHVDIFMLHVDINKSRVDIIMLHVNINKSHVNIIMLHVACAAQFRQPIENSLVLYHLKTLRLYTGFFEFELNHYLTNVARVKSTYWGRPILFINWSHDVTVTWYS